MFLDADAALACAVLGIESLDRGLLLQASALGRDHTTSLKAVGAQVEMATGSQNHKVAGKIAIRADVDLILSDHGVCGPVVLRQRGCLKVVRSGGRTKDCESEGESSINISVHRQNLRLNHKGAIWFGKNLTALCCRSFRPWRGL